MVDKATTQGYEDGVEGKGSKWESGIDSDRAEQNFEAGITSDNAEKLSDNAAEEVDAYTNNVAEAFGISSDEVAVADDWEDGVTSEEAQTNWQNNTSGTGEKWRDNADGQGGKWEDNSMDASQEWLDEAKKGLKDEL
jgi:hypothetical protein